VPSPHALPDSFGLSRLNQASAHEAEQAFLACCSSLRWAAAMAAGRPYPDIDSVYAAGDAALADLGAGDISDALSGHARIGARVTGAQGQWSRGEQAGMNSASDDVSRAMADGNAAYEAKFGQVYLISAAGKSAEQLLAALRSRLDNDPDAERAVVRGELAAINRLRLGKLLRPAAEVSA
jgi:2-oxo-4-hydroxy-4-carboxy-5-ureidoimidazoline decarboxylase